MTRDVRRMDENIVEVRQVYALELTITYGMNRGRFLENNRTTGSPSLDCSRTTWRKVISHSEKTGETEQGESSCGQTEDESCRSRDRRNDR